MTRANPLLIVSGEDRLRRANGERNGRAGDMLCFPPGGKGVHALFNRT